MAAVEPFETVLSRSTSKITTIRCMRLTGRDFWFGRFERMVNPFPSKKRADFPELLQVGLSIWHGPGTDASLEAAVDELVARALRSVNTRQLPVCGCLLLATADWCRFPTTSLAKRVAREVEREARLLGPSYRRQYGSVVLLRRTDLTVRPSPNRSLSKALFSFCYAPKLFGSL